MTVDVRRDVGRDDGTESRPAGQEVGGVDDLGFAQERVTARREGRIRMAVVAAARGVHEIAAEPYSGESRHPHELCAHGRLGVGGRAALLVGMLQARKS